MKNINNVSCPLCKAHPLYVTQLQKSIAPIEQISFINDIVWNAVEEFQPMDDPMVECLECYAKWSMREIVEAFHYRERQATNNNDAI